MLPFSRVSSYHTFLHIRYLHVDECQSVPTDLLHLIKDSLWGLADEDLWSASSSIPAYKEFETWCGLLGCWQICSSVVICKCDFHQESQPLHPGQDADRCGYWLFPWHIHWQHVGFPCLWILLLVTCSKFHTLSVVIELFPRCPLSFKSQVSHCQQSIRSTYSQCRSAPTVYSSFIQSVSLSAHNLFVLNTISVPYWQQSIRSTYNQSLSAHNLFVPLHIQPVT